jgi:hypothetical protein
MEKTIKKQAKEFWKIIRPAVVIIHILALYLYIAAVHWGVIPRVEKLEESDKDKTVQISSMEKQIPYIAKYEAIVKNLVEVAGDKMTAYEIVEVSRVIITQCQVYQDIELTPDLVFGMMQRESNFNPDAISHAGAFGIMQVTKTIWNLHAPKLGYSEFSRDIALNPIINTEVGIAEMVRLRQVYLAEGFDGWAIPLHSYFWGERLTRMLLNTKQRVNVPGLEYSNGIIQLAREWKEKGV